MKGTETRATEKLINDCENLGLGIYRLAHSLGLSGEKFAEATTIWRNTISKMYSTKCKVK